jgi:hypothetical protein
MDFRRQISFLLAQNCRCRPSAEEKYDMDHKMDVCPESQNPYSLADNQGEDLALACILIYHAFLTFSR